MPRAKSKVNNGIATRNLKDDAPTLGRRITRSQVPKPIEIPAKLKKSNEKIVDTQNSEENKSHSSSIKPESQDETIITKTGNSEVPLLKKSLNSRILSQVKKEVEDSNSEKDAASTPKEKLGKRKLSLSDEDEDFVPKKGKKNGKLTKAKEESKLSVKKISDQLKKEITPKNGKANKVETNRSKSVKKLPPKKAEIKKSIGAEKISPIKKSINIIYNEQTLEPLPDIEGFESCNESSGDEWEEVEELSESEDEKEPQIPKEGVDIVLNKSSKKEEKPFDYEGYIRMKLNRIKKVQQNTLHKANILCYLAHGIFINQILERSDLKAFALSTNTSNISKDDEVEDKADKLLEWFKKNYSYQANNTPSIVDIDSLLEKDFETRRASSTKNFVFMFILFVRSLGFNSRLCVAFYPVPIRPTDLLTAKNCQVFNKVLTDPLEETTDSNAQKIEPKIDEPSTSKDAAEKAGATRKLKRKLEPSSTSKDAGIEGADSVVELSDSDYEPSQPTKRIKNRKIVSSDSESEAPKDPTPYYWAEILINNAWYPVDPVNNICDKPYTIEAESFGPFTYVLGFENNSYVQDITKRYCSKWMTGTQKKRINAGWWARTLRPFRSPYVQRDRQEERQLTKTLKEQPIPKTIGELKDHPLYVLKRHLLRFQALYPQEPPVLGHVRDEDVYPRSAVHILRTKEKWLQEALVIKGNEEPYKIIKAAFTKNKITRKWERGGTYELYGLWQTEKYRPPIACDGIVPRNEFGNVDFFKPCMLPVGTVHVQLPGLSRVARKLKIDYALAVVGFELVKKAFRPLTDGYIVCKEHEIILREAWVEDQRNIEKREQEKRDKRVYGNWRRLIRKALIRERIQRTYLNK